MKPYEGCKVTGPYIRNVDGRYLITITKNKKRRTISYPKYLMDMHLGRYLSLNEHVHHMDENPTNNDINNLEVKTASEHARDHHLKYKDLIRVQCVQCDVIFEMSPKQQAEWNKTSRKRHKVKVGPFCSKQCVGRYRQIKQMEQRQTN